MSDAELTFRDEADYVSKYRRVLDHFDAVKIGLTATPALHTTEIFGRPVYTYSYRQAVIDGWLIDHEPPVPDRHQALAEDGITWQRGRVDPCIYLPFTGEIDTVEAARRGQLRHRRVQPAGRHRELQPRRLRRAGAADRPQPARQDDHLLRQRRPRRPGRRACSSEAFTTQYGAVEDDAVIEDHRRGRQAAATDPAVPERAAAERRRHGGPADDRHRRARRDQPRVPAPGAQPHPLRADARPGDPALRTSDDRQGDASGSSTPSTSTRRCSPTPTCGRWSRNPHVTVRAARRRAATPSTDAAPARGPRPVRRQAAGQEAVPRRGDRRAVRDADRDDPRASSCRGMRDVAPEQTARLVRRPPGGRPSSSTATGGSTRPRC